ncbi:MAG TPA: fibronectin type III domain-containing protein [Tepidisphaeraceae bacterium]|nr:fibronectin type III domain-containing protein [Tepidisphaeraceae bacterium]
MNRALPRYTFELSRLEPRALLCGEHVGDDGTFIAYDPPAPQDARNQAAAFAPPAALVAEAQAADNAPSGLPLLHSNPGAHAKLFLDFDGNASRSFPAYNIDSDPATFTAAEAANVLEMWARTAEKFAPFNIDVTTEDPGDRAARHAGEIVVGSTGNSAGYGYVGSFAYGGGYGVTEVGPYTSNKIAADIITHEAGHVLGLWHQSLYDGNGNKIQEYFVGDSQRAPIMGYLYNAQRALWWDGKSSQGANIRQDDLAILAGQNNAFGYRPDDHGDTFLLADTLTLAGGSESASADGLIEKTSDQDVFGFFAVGGELSLDLNVTAQSPSLDATLKLYRYEEDTYTLVASSAGASFSEALSYQATDSAYYYAVVSSAGGYGDIGQYTLTASYPDSPQPVNAPSHLVATPLANGSVDLGWADEAGNDDGYRVQRTSDGGASWATVATLGPSSESYIDTGTATGQTYHYRVFATTAGGASSEASNLARAETQLGPANGRVSSVGFTKATLAWDAVAGAAGYLIEQSLNGATWTTLAAAAGFATSHQVTGLAADSDSFYRVRTVMDGYSLPNNTIAVHTRPLVTPAAPQNLVATPAGPYAIDLAWDDVAEEERYLTQYSADGVTWNDFLQNPADNTTARHWSYSPETTYYYRVAAANEGGQSAWSNVASATTAVLTAPAAPSDVYVSGNYGSDTEIGWSDNSDNELDFRVEMLSDDGAGGQAWEVIGSVGELDYPYFYIQPLDHNTSYTVRVIATNTAGESAPSEAFTFTTATVAPTNLQVASTNYQQVNLTWGAAAGATGYRVQRQTPGEWYWETLGTPTGTSFTDTTAAQSTTYRYRVMATNGSCESLPSNEVSFLTTPDVPAAPTDLTATPSTSRHAITLTWTDGPFESGYSIERSTDGTSFAQVATTAANVATFTDPGRTPGVAYHYRVRASNSAGTSPYSAVATATGPTVLAPAAPTALVSDGSSDFSVTLRWTDNAHNELEYRIEALFPDPYGDDPYFAEVAVVSGGTIQWTDDSLSSGEQVTYRVRAWNEGGFSAYSNVLSTQTTPPAPGDLYAEATGSNRVNLAWEGVWANDGYLIQRSLTGTGGWANLASVAYDVTTYADNTVAPLTTYHYRVIATSPVGPSGASNVASATTPAVNLPATPQNVSAAAASTSQINVSWSDVANETGYRVERSGDGGATWSALATVAANVTTHGDTGLAAGASFSYRVIATNSGGQSNPSAAAIAATFVAAPAALTATPVTATRVDLAWADVNGETGYRIERSTDGGATWSLLASTGANVTTHSNTTALAGTSYRYRVRGYNGAGNGAFSPVASALTVPAAPTPAATPVSASQINLSWTNVAGESGYTVERSNDGGATWQMSANVAADVTAYSDTGLTAGTAYTYRVRANNATGSSGHGGTASATTAPAAPGGLVATSAGATQINVSWNDVAGETGYVVERSADGASGWAQVGTTSTGVTAFANTGLAAGTTYFYRVRATGSAGGSGYSATASATTQSLVPAAPGNLAATALSRTSIRLTWADNSGNETGFRIERSLNGTSGWAQVGSVGANVTTFENTGLTRNTRYYYRVVAYNASGTSPYSNVANTFTLK